MEGPAVSIVASAAGCWLARSIQTAKHFGGLDALIGNADAIHMARFLDLGADEFDRLMNVYARATLALAQSAHQYALPD